MFLEVLIVVWYLTKFDQNTGNHVKEIARTTAPGNV
jgi:hypothetical protein